VALCGVPLDAVNTGKRDLWLLGEWLAPSLVASSRTAALAAGEDVSDVASVTEVTAMAGVEEQPLVMEAAEPEIAAQPSFAVHDESSRPRRRRIARGTDVNGAVRRRHQTIPPGFWSTCKALLEVEDAPVPTSPTSSGDSASPQPTDGGTSDGPAPAKRVIWG
jgi:hypothetical protein